MAFTFWNSLSYHDRLFDQEEINQFLENIFNYGNNMFDPYNNGANATSLLDKKMNFSKYD